MYRYDLKYVYFGEEHHYYFNTQYFLYMSKNDWFGDMFRDIKITFIAISILTDNGDIVSNYVLKDFNYRNRLDLFGRDRYDRYLKNLLSEYYYCLDNNLHWFDFSFNYMRTKLDINYGLKHYKEYTISEFF